MLSQERHLAWNGHLPKVRASMSEACRALSLTAAPEAAGSPPWWMGITAIFKRLTEGRPVLSYNNSSKVLRRPKGAHNHTLPPAVAAVIMTVTAGQPRDMTRIGQGMGIWCCWWVRPALPSLPGCPSSARILRPDCQEATRAPRVQARGWGWGAGGVGPTMASRYAGPDTQLRAQSEMAVTCSRTHSCQVCSDSRALHTRPCYQNMLQSSLQGPDH